MKIEVNVKVPIGTKLNEQIFRNQLRTTIEQLVQRHSIEYINPQDVSADTIHIEM